MFDRRTHQRFWIKVDKRGPDDCWMWTAAQTGSGYGCFPTEHGTRAHRVSFMMANGPIGEGLHLDHVCRERLCVNPAHLNPVTPRENAIKNSLCFSAVNAAKTHCIHGHPFDEINTYRTKMGRRVCRECRRKHDLNRSR